MINSLILLSIRSSLSLILSDFSRRRMCERRGTGLRDLVREREAQRKEINFQSKSDWRSSRDGCPCVSSLEASLSPVEVAGAKLIWTQDGQSE